VDSSAEHILLESDFREVPDPRIARKVHARIAFRSRLRWRRMQLELFDYYYLSVRSASRSTKLEYVLDLRFVGMPQVSRHISWRWIAASLLLMSLGYGILQFGHFAPPWWQRVRLAGCAALMATWSVATLVALYRTTETVRLFSTGGAAKLLEYTGGLGTLHDMRRFLEKVAAHLRLAAAARRSTRAKHLRDELREHARLKGLGVLCEPEYESAKASILGKHSHPARVLPVSRKPSTPAAPPGSAARRAADPSGGPS
jgi:hypothetical protein